MKEVYWSGAGGPIETKGLKQSSVWAAPQRGVTLGEGASHRSE